jgi:heptosyltransferase-2
MRILILKLGATGDVVRTTPLLRRLNGEVTWITASRNKPILEGISDISEKLTVLDWHDRSTIAGKSYDLVINLEDEPESARLLNSVHAGRLFGAYETSAAEIAYTADSAGWFDMSLISRYGREQADVLKLQNRETYQELIFSGLNFEFRDDRYVLPPTAPSDLCGDVAIAPEAGPVWPMKKWAYYDWLKNELESHGLKVNFLPTRPTLLEHLADVRGHHCVVCGDSLPMHLALGSNIPCVALFNCTSPWEIWGYGILTKLVSPLLGEFFYRRAFDARATTAISQAEVLYSVLQAIDFNMSVKR